MPSKPSSKTWKSRWPGAASIAAAVAPDTKDGYFYFLAKNDGSGAMAYAKTNAEQIANEKKFGYLPS